MPLELFVPCSTDWPSLYVLLYNFACFPPFWLINCGCAARVYIAASCWLIVGARRCADNMAANIVSANSGLMKWLSVMLCTTVYHCTNTGRTKINFSLRLSALQVIKYCTEKLGFCDYCLTRIVVVSWFYTFSYIRDWLVITYRTHKKDDIMTMYNKTFLFLVFLIPPSYSLFSQSSYTTVYCTLLIFLLPFLHSAFLLSLFLQSFSFLLTIVFCLFSTLSP